ncbi:MAG: SDR family oxidoreductase [Hyphomicrobiaceae bacterium]|nr:SDR family oxidoreductase [Hyphomicrobiaceae bacterium]
MDLKLAGLTALVTGASAGIGIGIVECLSREGARVALAGRNRAALEAVASRCRDIGAAGTVVLTGDVATADGCRRIATEALAAFGGRVDILVNNAGGSRPLGQAEETEAFWDEAHALNFASARRVTKPLLAPMKANRFGRIINITGAIYGKAVNGAGPSKAALLAWSRQICFELAPHGITVNCVAPGRINSVQILERLHPTPQSREAFIRDNIPAGRFGEPEELGVLVAFLASPVAGYISGAHIPVDGGAVRIAV